MLERVVQSEFQGSGLRPFAQTSPWSESGKRVLDLLVAIPLLIAALPLAVVIALAIKLDSPGPVLFRQERIGLAGKPFRILKFRTMFWPPRSDLHKRHVIELANEEAPGAQLRLPEDPRVTPTGRFLRRWSLDELPNLWNVIVGEMSLVGPRPLVDYEVNALGEKAGVRLSVKPGITGLAQVEGRLDIPMHRRSDYDLIYVSDRSLWRDLWLLVMTPYALIRRRGA